MNIPHYYNTQKQLEEAEYLLKELSEHLVTADVLPIKQIILIFFDEISLPANPSLALNKLILSISNYLTTYNVTLTIDNAERLKKLYELLST